MHANTTVTQQIKRRDRYQSRSSGWVHEWRSRSGGPQDFWLLPVLRHLFIYAFSNTASAKPRRVLFKGRQKLFCRFHCVFRSHQRITYETPIRGYSQYPPKIPRVGQTHSRLPSCLRQQVERKIFVMLNFRIRQLSRGEKNCKFLSLNFSGSKQTAQHTTSY